MPKDANRDVERAVRAAFLRLAHATPLEKLSVSSVCKEAGISRTTFYSYYENVDALVAAIKYELLYDVRRIFQDFEYIDLDKVKKSGQPIPMFAKVYEYVYKNWDAFIYLFDRDSRFFDQEWGENIRATTARYLGNDLSIEQKAVVCSLCLGCFDRLTWDWFAESITATPSQMAEITTRAFISIVREFSG